jgi:colicin import membrane protein
MLEFIKEYRSGLTVSVLVHGSLFVLIGLNLVLMPKPSTGPVRLAIDAVVVPDIDALRQREELEQQRLEDIQRERERKRQEAERQRAEEQRQREEQVRLAEQERKQAEEARLAEERRQADAERERAQTERREREAAEARSQQRREAEFAAQLAEEEQRLAALESGLLDRYVALIRQRVERNWVRPASAKAGLECEVRVSQIPGGEVVDVRMGRCNGDEAVIRSIENAVYRASPFPPPPDPTLFERTLIFVFKPQE